MSFEFSTVPVEEISAESIYRITTNTDCEGLVRSIKRAGLIAPPVLSSQRVVVSGFRRIAAMKALGWEKIPVRLLPEDATPLSCAMIAVSENVSQRPLNLIETSRAVALLDAALEEKKTISSLLRELGIPGGDALFGKVKSLCSLPEPMQNGILSEDISLPSALLLEKMSEGDMLALSSFLQTIKFNMNKQRELIGIITEIAAIEEKSISEILKSKEISEILEDKDADSPRKAGLVRSFLKKRRYPNITKAEEGFEKLKNSLSLGDKVALSPPPGFEGKRYTLTLSFATLKELEQHRETLSRLLEDEGLKSLLESRA